MIGKLLTAGAVALAFAACSKGRDTLDYSRVKAGDMVPAFEIVDTSGLVTYVSREAGVPVLIYFFWSECGTCREVTPEVLRLWGDVAEDPAVRLVCIARGGDYASPDQARDYWAVATSRADSVPPLYYDENRRVYDMFARQGVPRFCVVDADGLIRWHAEGSVTADQLRTQLMRALDPVAPAR